MRFPDFVCRIRPLDRTMTDCSALVAPMQAGLVSQVSVIVPLASRMRWRRRGPAETALYAVCRRRTFHVWTDWAICEMVLALRVRKGERAEEAAEAVVELAVDGQADCDRWLAERARTNAAAVSVSASAWPISFQRSSRRFSYGGEGAWKTARHLSFWPRSRSRSRSRPRPRPLEQESPQQECREEAKAKAEAMFERPILASAPASISASERASA